MDKSLRVRVGEKIGRDGRSLVTILLGQFSVQLIALATYPILTRLYSPEAFGHYGLICAYLGIFVVLATGQYHLAIPNPGQDGIAAKLFRLSSVLLLCVTTVAALLVLLAGDSLLGGWSISGEEFAVIYAIVVLCGFNEIYKSNNTRYRQFRYTAIASNLNRLVSSFSKILLSFVSLHPLSLLISDLAAHFVSLLYFRSRKVSGDAGSSGDGQPSYLAVAKRYRVFPLYNSFTSLLAILLYELPTMVFGALFSAAELGYFVLTQRIFLQPSILLGNAIGSAISRTIAEKRAAGLGLVAYYRRISLLILAFSFLPVVFLWAYGEQTLMILLGENWRESGVLLEIVAVLLPARLIQIQTNTFLTVIESIRLNLLLKALDLLVIALVFVAMAGSSMVELVTVLVLVQLVLTMLSFLVCVRVLRRVE